MATEKSQVRLVDVCEPIFTFVCDLNRLGRAGANQSVESISNEVDSVWEKIEESIGRSNHLQRQWKEVEPALCCFVDSMIEHSGLPAATQWKDHRLAVVRFKILTGENSFYDSYLEKELENPAGDADSTERLEVYYACLFLGFEGAYEGFADQLQKVQSRVAGRVRQLVGGAKQSKVTPEAYDHLNTTPLNLDSAPAIWGAAILSVFFVIAFIVGTVFLYKNAMKDMEKAVTAINQPK